MASKLACDCSDISNADADFSRPDVEVLLGNRTSSRQDSRNENSGIKEPAHKLQCMLKLGNAAETL